MIPGKGAAGKWAVSRSPDASGLAAYTSAAESGAIALSGAPAAGIRALVSAAASGSIAIIGYAAIGVKTSPGVTLSPADIAAIADAVWAHMSRTLTADPGASSHATTQAAVAAVPAEVWAHPLP